MSLAPLLIVDRLGGSGLAPAAVIARVFRAGFAVRDISPDNEMLAPTRWRGIPSRHSMIPAHCESLLLTAQFGTSGVRCPPIAPSMWIRDRACVKQ
jgi:hypothetical protein